MKSLIVYIISIGIALYSLPCDAKRPVKTFGAVAAVAGTNSVAQLYAELKRQQVEIGSRIADLSTQLHTASKSKAKKITKQINLLTDELVAVERRLAAFPVSVTDPSSRPNTIDHDKKLFRQELDSIAAIRVAQSDPFAGRLSSDPQLDKMYRDYLASSGGKVIKVEEEHNQLEAESKSQSSTFKNDNIPAGTVYRVMIAISKTKIPTSQFSSLDNVLEQSMPSGGYVYYQGSYESIDQAQQACNKILAARHFRDAFVVAMNGTRRVPLR